MLFVCKRQYNLSPVGQLVYNANNEKEGTRGHIPWGQSLNTRFRPRTMDIQFEFDPRAGGER